MSNLTSSSFCGPEGWGPLSSTRIDLTLCFENGFILLFPPFFITIFGFISLYQQRMLPKQIINGFAFHYYTKLVLGIGISIVAALDLAEKLGKSSETTGSALFSSFETLFGLLLALFLHYFNHFRTESPSPILQLYWIFHILACSIKLRTLFLLKNNDPLNQFSQIEFSLLIPLIIIALILFIVETLPKSHAEMYTNLEDGEIKSSGRCPEETAGLFSLLSFWWMNGLIILGYNKPLNETDLWDINEVDFAKNISTKFEESWEKQKQSFKPSLAKAITNGFGLPFILAAFYKLLQDTLAFTQPILLGYLIDFIGSYNPELNMSMPKEIGYWIVAGMLITAILQTLILHQYFHICFTTGMRVRSAIVTAVYAKALKLSNSSRQKYTVGEIVNLMSVDSQKIMDLAPYLHMLWSGPFQIIVALYLLYQTLGFSVFAGVAILLGMIPLNALLANKIRIYQKIQMGNKDARVKLMDEILNGIKVIKLYAWERSFAAKIFEVRQRELEILKKLAGLNSISGFTWSCAPFLVSLATFSFYVVVSDEPLTADKAFVSLALFNLLQFPLIMFPTVISSCIEASVSFSRLTGFLLAEELDLDAVKREAPKNFYQANTSLNDPIVVNNGDFSWDRITDVSVLNNINFRCKRASLNAIIGSVGAGKSSLLSAILGEMIKNRGEVYVQGSVAYVPQQAWIMNATIRDNILFGLPYDEYRYHATIESCALQADFAIFEAGDLTEIGEKGINLSGGQKQRVSLARAVYNDADIYILDDPLSAVDSHVGDHIFNAVVGPQGVLRNKVRLFVTNGIQFLSRCDNIITMKDGSIAEIGSFEELMRRQGNLYNMISEFGKEVGLPSEEENTLSQSKKSRTRTKKPAPKPKEANEKAKLIAKEEQRAGAVDNEVYKSYISSIGLWSIVFLISLYVLGQLSQVGTSLWLSYWSEQNSATGSNSNIPMFLGVYASLGVAQAILIIAQSLVVYIVCGIKSSKYLHENLLHRTLRAPMSFFDTTPIGRIINRFSKDIYTIDDILPRTFGTFFRTTFSVFAIVCVISVSTPLFMVAIIPLGFLYYFIQKYYLPTSRELKRLESITRSPIYAHFSETVSGAASIRAYSQQQKFTVENEKRLDLNNRAYYPTIASNRWLATRLEFIGSCVVLFASLFAVVSYGKIEAGIAGLSVTYALSVTQTLNWMVRQSCEIEANIVSVERIKEYMDIAIEAPEIIEDNQPNPSWPEKGVIQFDNYATRYRPGLDLVLKGVDFHVNAGEKIGIVGRTGAGKSSITLALFRIIESASGTIIIDGINVSEIGLFNLRSRLTIIPQDPVLFSGTIRSNLDPFNQHSDEELWRALASANLSNFINTLDAKLDAHVNQGGENFSVGQRQLICLGRALLRKTQILVLDEATAAIDVETDNIIQQTIRREFKDCTILTIAHRLNTIMDSDRILVLDKGVVAEFASPEQLLRTPTSLFYSLSKKAGLI
eukprot:TRINITY_DN165_c0_g2_i1.p1 TRINITY_DN165_c0_g2~~TRINITY_DN165_c0_g2_i1.p1  ORF type:complete len:1466 (-),score=614.85 TRINITY_DN165_c0_g2_i1:64-4461(-)